MARAKLLDEHLTSGSFRARDFEGRQGTPLGPSPSARLAEFWREAERFRAEWAAAVEDSSAARNARGDLQRLAGRIYEVAQTATSLEEIISERIGPHPRRTARVVSGGARVERFSVAYMRHIEGRWAGLPVELEPWQKSRIVRPAFATGADGLRSCREVYLQTPKKNGKSLLSAVLSAYLLVADAEPGARVFAGAADRDQARLVHEVGKRMLERSALAPYIDIRRDEIVVPSIDSVWKVLAADAVTDEGINMHAGTLDEYHHHESDALLELFRRSGTARDQPLLITTTNAGEDPDTWPCGESYRQARAVIEGHVGARDDLVAFVPELAPRDRQALERIEDLTDKERGRLFARIAQVNPASFVGADKIAEAYRAERPANFRRYRANQWGDTALESWLRREQWEACEGETRLEECEALAVAADFGSRHDTCAIVLGGLVGGVLHVEAEVWARKPERGEAPAAHHLDARDLSPELVEEIVAELAGVYEISAFLFDPWKLQRSASLIEEAHGLEAIEITQNDRVMCPASEDLYQLVSDRRLRHTGDPVLAAHVMAGRVQETARGRNWRIGRAPDRGGGLAGRGHRSQVRRSHPIDALVSLAMLSAWAHEPSPFVGIQRLDDDGGGGEDAPSASLESR